MLATFGRGGRKGGTDFADYHVEVGKGQVSIQGGWWEPNKERLEIFRGHLVNNTPEGRNIKAIVSSKEFVDMFGPPRTTKVEKKKGKKQSGKDATPLEKVNLWGSSNELKKCPKDYPSDHPEIEWLKLKSFWVEKR